MEHGWFLEELTERAKGCGFPPLITTATDGDEGWFRNVKPVANFWNYFYQKALDDIRAGNSPMRPIFIDEYLDRFGAHGRVRVRRGAWNTGAHHGWEFRRWQESRTQRDALARIRCLSNEYHRLAKRAAGRAEPDLRRVLREAQWRLLRSETSCDLDRDEEWEWRTRKDLDDVTWHLGEARALLGPEPKPTPEKPDAEAASGGAGG
jgi:hypothetical protein